jgi:pseudouridine-5'-phosphate glycosidase/pseudouridine kinase
MTNGSLFAAPVPAKYEAAGEKIQNAVEQAVVEAEELGISSRGKAVTPWLLNRVADLTAGVSLANSASIFFRWSLVMQCLRIRCRPNREYGADR